MVTISKFNYENPRFINLLNRQGNIPPEVERTVRSDCLYRMKNLHRQKNTFPMNLKQR